MGFIKDFLFGKSKTEKIWEELRSIIAYTPSFTTYEGGLYEMDLTRAAIHAFANQCSKLKPEMTGEAKKALGKQLLFKPNPFMDTSKFLYRLATILSIHNTAFIVPLYSDDYMNLIGYYPLLPSRCDVVEYKKELWLRYTFPNGERAAIEFDRVGILTQYQYRDDFFGETNSAMDPTLELMDMQNQGMQNAIKKSAAIQFMAKLGQVVRPEDMEKERKNFSKMNLNADYNDTGVMIFDGKYSDVKQVDYNPYVINSEQMNSIKENVFNYFGVNESILQNKYDEDSWNAFYEGKIEPFALQLGLVMTNMTFTEKEKAFGNSIMFTTNRMQYASNKTKLQVSIGLFDRGILSLNDVMDIWNLPNVEDGDKRYIRLEYTEVDKLGDEKESTEDEEDEE